MAGLQRQRSHLFAVTTPLRCLCKCHQQPVSSRLLLSPRIGACILESYLIFLQYVATSWLPLYGSLHKEERRLSDELANMTRQATCFFDSVRQRGPSASCTRRDFTSLGGTHFTKEGNSRHVLYANTTVRHPGVASSPWHPPKRDTALARACGRALHLHDRGTRMYCTCEQSRCQRASACAARWS